MTRSSIRSGAAFIGLASFALIPWISSADDDHSLELSDEFVPYEELGDGFTERPKPVTEIIEDTLFPENRERDELIKERNEGNPDIEVPERKLPYLARTRSSESGRSPPGSSRPPVPSGSRA